jgi:hypothetical protein
VRKRSILITLVALIVVVGSFSLGSAIPRKRGRRYSAAQEGQGRGVVQDHVVYWLAFHKIAVLKRKADEAQRAGKIKEANGFLSLSRGWAGLSANQADTIEAVAESCDTAVAAQDAKASQVVVAKVSRYHGGIVPVGETVKPSPELAALQSARNAIILSARDQLHRQLGATAFAIFDAFARQHVRVNVSVAQPN